MCKDVQEQLSTPQVPRSQRNAAGLTSNGSAQRDRDNPDANGKQLDLNELERLFPASPPPPDQHNKEVVVRKGHWGLLFVCHTFRLQW